MKWQIFGMQYQESDVHQKPISPGFTRGYWF